MVATPTEVEFSRQIDSLTKGQVLPGRTSPGGGRFEQVKAKRNAIVQEVIDT